MIKDRIKELRITHNYTLEDMGKLLGVSAATVQRYENPQGIKNIPYDIMVKYAEIFGVEPGYLFGGGINVEELPPTEITAIDAVDDMPIVKPRRHLKLNHKQTQYTISVRALEMADKYEKADEMTKQMVDRILGMEE